MCLVCGGPLPTWAGRPAREAVALAEATEEAGDRPVDPELLATLTEALAAAFDQGR